MNTYYFEGFARQRNAIGIRHPFNAQVKAENLKDANLKLYDQWEHIHIDTVSAWTPTGQSIIPPA